MGGVSDSLAAAGSASGEEADHCAGFGDGGESEECPGVVGDAGRGGYRFRADLGEGIYYMYYRRIGMRGAVIIQGGVLEARYDGGCEVAEAGRMAARFEGACCLKCGSCAVEAIDSFNTVYPMEVLATAKEVAALKAKYKDSAFLVFPEDREYPIRMRRDLPYRWIVTGARGTGGGCGETRGELCV